MKINARTLLAVFASVLLAACSTSEPRTASPGFELAASYMQAVERNARHKGIDVVWINAPARSHPKEDEPEGD